MKIFYSFLFLFLLLSCSFPSYVFQNEAQTIGLDFSQGKWLLNEINAPRSVQEKLTKLVLRDFSEFRKENIGYTLTSNNLLMQRITKTNLSVNELRDIKLGTNYDYFINVKALALKNEFGNIDIRSHKLQSEGNKEVSIFLEVYDLNNLVILYNQEVKGFVSLPQNSNDVTISYSIDKLILGGYKKIINDINKKSIKK